MTDRPTLSHECKRLLSPATRGTWDEPTNCITCDTLDAIWQNGYDAGRETGKFIGRFDAQQERTERLTTAARVILLLVIMGILVDIINHRSEGVTE